MLASFIILLLLLLVELAGVKYQKEPQNIINYQFSNILRGICCFPVIFSHIPDLYSNPYQSVAGSFAFVAVIFYFMFSSYGLEISASGKPGYLSHFFRNRFSSILVPYILCILLRLLFHTDLTYGGANFVHVLVVYYIIFYFAHTQIHDTKHRELFLIICTLGYSIGGFFLGYKLHLPKIGLNWYPESIGLTIGIVLAYHYDRINQFFQRKVLIKTIIAFVIAFFLRYTYINYLYQYYFFGNYLYRLIMGTSIIVFIILLSVHIKLGNTFTVKLGKLSFEIFLYHGLFLKWLLTLPVTWTSNTYIAAVFICSFITAFVMNKFSSLIIRKISVSSNKASV